jgi:hypothetical protein
MGNRNQKSYDLAASYDTRQNNYIYNDDDCTKTTKNSKCRENRRKMKRPLSECFGFHYNFNLVERQQDNKLDAQPKRSNTIQLINYKADPSSSIAKPIDTNRPSSSSSSTTTTNLKTKQKKENSKLRKIFANKKNSSDQRKHMRNTVSDHSLMPDSNNNNSNSCETKTIDQKAATTVIIRSLTDYNIQRISSTTVGLTKTIELSSTKSDTDDDETLNKFDDDNELRFSMKKRKLFTKSPALYNIHEITQRDHSNTIKISDLIEHTNDYNESYKPIDAYNVLSSDSVSYDYDETSGIDGSSLSTTTVTSTPLKLLNEVNRKLIDYKQFECNGHALVVSSSSALTTSTNAKYADNLADSDIEIIMNDFDNSGECNNFFDRNFDKLSMIMLNLTLINVIAPLAISECTTLNNSMQDLRFYETYNNETRLLNMTLAEAF